MSYHRFQNPSADQSAVCKDCYLPLARYLSFLKMKNKIYPIFKIETLLNEKFYFKSYFKSTQQTQNIAVRLKKSMHHQSLNVCEYKFTADNYDDVSVEISFTM
jgi:hypothetical protein